MADGTGIEWTDATWNPVTGCTKVSPGCANCYITSTPPFRIAGRTWDKTGSTGLMFYPERLDQPIRWTRPRMIFVNSLSDMFHEDIPREFIDRVFATMALAPQHIFQVLTKRPERMRAYMLEGKPWQRVSGRAFEINRYSGTAAALSKGEGWPLPNVWLGTTIENARHIYRADVLREVPAAVRFISAEPLIGSLYEGVPLGGEQGWTEGKVGTGEFKKWLDLTGIDWVICGGESGGRHVRPMKVEWAREIRDACLTVGAGGIGRVSALPPRPAFFFKQWGSHDAEGNYLGRSGKSSGKLLDGSEWCEFPMQHPLAA